MVVDLGKISREYRCITSCGDCCREMMIPIGDSFSSEYVRWVGLHENIKLVEFRGLICINLPYKCKHLTENNKCEIYEDRPEVCKRFKCEKGSYE